MYVMKNLIFLIVMLNAVLVESGEWYDLHIQKDSNSKIDIPHPSYRIDGNKDFFMIAHAGSPLKQPENTIEGLEVSIKDGANALEVDLSMTYDYEIVLWHDWDPNSLVSIARQKGLEGFKYLPFCPDATSKYRVPIDRLKYKDFIREYGYKLKDTDKKLEYKIPTIEIFLEWLHNKKSIKFIYLDVKFPSNYRKTNRIKYFVKKMNSLLERYDLIDKAVLFTPYDSIFDEMVKVKNFYGLKVRLGRDMEIPPDLVNIPVELNPMKASGRAIVIIDQFVDKLDKLIKNSCEYIAVGRPTKLTLVGGWYTYKKIIDRLVKKKEKISSNIKIICWTINDPKEIRELYNKGINGIMSDDVSVIARSLSF